MKLEHTQKKSANRGFVNFAHELIGIARKHGQRLKPQNNTHMTKPKPKRRRITRTTYPKH